MKMTIGPGNPNMILRGPLRMLTWGTSVQILPELGDPRLSGACSCARWQIQHNARSVMVPTCVLHLLATEGEIVLGGGR